MNEYILGDSLIVLKDIPDNSVNTIITSPPYNKKGLDKRLKSYNDNKTWKKYQINYDTHGDDMSEDDYQKWQIDILNECHRVLKDDGSMFYNHKPRRFKNKIYLPTDFILDSNFNLYQQIIWNRGSSPNIHKNILYPTTEYIYWLTKTQSTPKVFKKNIPLEYQKEVWNINPAKPTKLHPAPFPELIPELCILLTTEVDDLVLDPFAGTGTTLNISKKLNRRYIGIDISENYKKIFEN